MKIENKDFWEKEHIIETQEVLKKASDFETYLLNQAQERFSKFGKIKNIKVFGCGTGREVESIAEVYQPDFILASDISENMIAKCNENLQLWGLSGITKTAVANAVAFTEPKNTFEVVTIFNSMLTYVPNRNDRMAIFNNSLHLLKDNGLLIGTVHNQVGAPLKTLYFQIRSLFSFVLGPRVGNRNTGFNGFSVPGYYYAKKQLLKDLTASGFSAVEVLSLEEFYQQQGKSYDRKKGYNNLIFIATKL
ncbi:methyltransferase domain-containing protein [Flavobacterium sp.]|uniref:class I SAM-dependent methyltransferase n=1 Tax=Flavobacterium sp. TaxID=239 RepID=UPI002612E51E|nr:methyltransferase domain-containing protein [Flavobacterium sp.]